MQRVRAEDQYMFWEHPKI